MWRLEVDVIKREGTEKWPMEDLARVFLQDNAFAVECGDGSLGLLELDAVGRIIAEHPSIVEDTVLQHYQGLEWLNE